MSSRNARGPTRWTFALALVVLSSGCSFVFVRGAPDNVPPGTWGVECSESYIAPTIDLLYGSSALISALAITAAANDDDPYNGTDEDEARVVAPIMGVVGAVVLYSAYTGYNKASRCRQIHDTAIPPYGYSPYGYPPPPYPYPYPQPQPQPTPAPYPAPAPAPAPGGPPGGGPPGAPR
jgi:hypothetical protein